MFCSNCGIALLPAANFCHSCGRSLDQERTSQTGGSEVADDENESTVNDSIKDLFHRGYPYNEIVGMLAKQGVFMHIRTLKRKLKDLGLSRRGCMVDEETLRSAISKEIAGPGRLAGYRSVWHALRLRHQIHVPRNKVARLIKEMDPQGVEDRKSRRLSRRRYLSLGPNFCWHIDGIHNLLFIVGLFF